MTTPAPFDKIALLNQTFSGLDDEELRDLASLTELHTYPPDCVLCHDGAYEEVFYIIASGQAETTKKISDNEGQRLLRMAGPGDYFGEMALIQKAPRAATVRTVSDCTVLEMGKADFEAMLSRSPRMALSIIRSTLDRMRSNDQMAIAELQRTNKVLAMLDRNKLEFIQVAAHELRTPLTVIKGYMSVLKFNPGIRADATLAEVLEGIEKGSERMHEIVNAMLDVTRIDSEKLQLHPVPVPVKSVVNDTVRDVLRSASGRHLTINIEHDADTPTINADPTMIQKALYHLVMNAVKYTPDGKEVTIRTRPVVMDKNRPGVEVVVKDQGIGLDPEHHELIFEKFYQVGSVALHSSSKTAFKGGGPGLGLAIARGVARAHGGKLWVESPGHDEVNYPGSTFFLQLPVDPQAPDGAARA
ncbi:MAG: cyclic nucleotide-binding domain-containing protein [Chloroflexi bacterium]|nr:cyclic nucleotide-binding domain-containing protein [Chloroflexota bacterium]